MQVVRHIDRGGFGTVDEVVTDSGVSGARKSFSPRGVTDPGEMDTLRRRFEREVRIQSAIRHPNIMPVLEADMAASPPWFVMPLASISLEQKIRADHASGQPFDDAPWLDILAAVEELHRLGYVHRDLKPANVLLVGNTWMLSDFGLILPTMRDTTVLTGTGSAYGSFSYAAPEQATDFKHTPEQADIFAIGCILNDALEIRPSRIPYAQIRAGGPYGPLLEKCTEVDFRRRFPTVASLRAALFDLWRTSGPAAGPIANRDGAGLVEELVTDPTSPETWRRLLQLLEELPVAEKGPILKSVNAQMVLALHGIDDLLFARLVSLMCTWASGTAFNFSYCDVVGDRLLEAYKVAAVRPRCEIVLAALELAVSHNRWHVMQQVGAMLGPTADNGLVDRFLIEVGLDGRIERQLRRIEGTITWRRSQWHERIAGFLNQQDERARPTPTPA